MWKLFCKPRFPRQRRSRKLIRPQRTHNQAQSFSTNDGLSIDSLVNPIASSCKHVECIVAFQSYTSKNDEQASGKHQRHHPLSLLHRFGLQNGGRCILCWQYHSIHSDGCASSTWRHWRVHHIKESSSEKDHPGYWRSQRLLNDTIQVQQSWWMFWISFKLSHITIVARELLCMRLQVILGYLSCKLKRWLRTLTHARGGPIEYLGCSS